MSGEGERVILSPAEKERRILEMYLAGHSYKEICEALRVSPKTIVKVLRRASEDEAEAEDRIEEKIESHLGERLEEIKGVLGKHSEDIEKLFEKWDRVCLRLAEFERCVNSPGRLLERVKDLEERVERLEKTCQGIRSDLDRLAKRLKEVMNILERIYGGVYFI